MSEPRRTPEHLNTKDLATRLGLHHNTLIKWRITGNGPPYLKVGGRVIYRWWEVEGWLTKHGRVNTIQS